MRMIAVLASASALDMLFGDPRAIPHPVVLIGRMIAAGERLLRRVFPKTRPGELAGGAVLTVLVAGTSFAVPFILLFALYRLNVWAATAAETFLCFQILAAKSLKTESMKVCFPLKSGDLGQARRLLSYIVGRDTQDLDEQGIARAAVETVAENTTDGVIAPLLFMAVGGAPLGLLYKAVNTLDSMIGYKNETYLYFGRFAARLDDAANFIPARLAAVLMIAAARVLGYDAKGAARVFRRDRKKHASPNSAQTESACAGALGVQLAGSASYFGVLREKPTIGEPLRPIAPEDIARAGRLMTGTAVLGLLLACLARAAAIFLI